MVICPSCKLLCDELFDDYKYNVEWDRKLLNAEFIYSCETCDLMFAHPMPSAESMTDYYRNWYRAKGRPHHSTTPLEPSFRHLAYLAYLTQAVDMRRISDVYEIGAGWGEIGLLLKRQHPHLRIVASEPDRFVRQSLTNRGYSVVESPSDNEFDLILSFHSLEHFSSPEDFFALTSNLRSNGYLMLEVPNCDRERGWSKRVYDSPHLLFFTRSALINVTQSNGFEEVSCHVAGQSIESISRLEASSKAIHSAWTPEKRRRQLPLLSQLLSWMARVAPLSIKKLGQRVLVKSEISEEVRNSSSEFDNSSYSGWVLRGIFQKST